MADSSASKRVAVVTGANKGIGLEICRQLAGAGVIVVLTAKDEERGRKAVELLQQDGISDNVFFHQLDVVDPASVASLADFVGTRFGKLDILVNNVAIIGIIFHGDAIVRASEAAGDWYIPNEWAKEVLNDEENLTEERVDEVIKVFVRHFKQGCLKENGWSVHVSAYKLSKSALALNAYTRILAKKYPNMLVNFVSPGYTKTDMTRGTGLITATQGAENVARLALVSADGPSGLFFILSQLSSY